MALADAARCRSAGARRAGHCLAVGFSAAFLFVLSGWPGWQAVPFLTSDTGQVLWLVSLWLAAGIAADVAYLAYDPPLLNSLGDLLTTRIGLAAAIRIRPRSEAVPEPCVRASALRPDGLAAASGRLTTGPGLCALTARDLRGQHGLREVPGERDPDRARRRRCRGGLTAIGGGIALAAGLEGERYPVEWLTGTPFSSYLIPGLILSVAVGGSAAAAAVLIVTTPEVGAWVSVLAGVILTGQIAGEIRLLTQPVTWIEVVYFGAGLAMVALGLTLRVV